MCCNEKYKTKEIEKGDRKMNSLVKILNQDGKLVVTSRQIAEDFEKEHNDTKKRIRELIKDMGEISHNYFISSEYVDSMNRTQEEYLLTRDGFSLLVMGFTGSKALEWKLKYIEAFNKIEQALKEQKQLSPMDQLRLQYQVIESHEEKLNELDSKVETLSLSMNISDGQAKTIQALVHKRVKTLCYGNESPAYKNESLRKKVYRYLWRTLKDYLNVAVYHNILRKDYDAAINYISAITLQGALLREVQDANSQVGMEV